MSLLSAQNEVELAAYQESEVEPGDHGGGDGEGGELEVAEVADEGLRDDVDPVQRDPLEDGRPHDAPQLLRLRPPLRRRPPRAPIGRRCDHPRRRAAAAAAPPPPAPASHTAIRECSPLTGLLGCQLMCGWFWCSAVPVDV